MALGDALESGGRVVGDELLGEPLREMAELHEVEHLGIVLAGAPLAGLARTLRGQLPVPVVDGVSSAVRHAESLVALAPGRAVRGSFSAPPKKPHRGLPDAIARLLDGA